MSNRKRRLSADEIKQSAKRKKVTNKIIKQFQNTLEDTLDNNKFDDVTFLVGPRNNQQIFHANKFVFSTQSHPFEAMLFGPLSYSRHHPIIIPDVDPTAFDYLHKLFYMKQPHLANDIVVDVLYAANKYLINIVINECKETLRSINNMNDLYSILTSFAKYADSVFAEDIKEFIQNTKFIKQNIMDFVEHSQFIHLSPFIVENIIDVIPTEIIKYESAKKYCIEFVQNRSRSLDEKCEDISWQSMFKEKFLKYIKIKELTSDYLLMVVKNDKIISSDILLDIIDSKKTVGFKLNDVLLTEPEIKCLKVGCFVDIRDERGAFYAAKIIKKEWFRIKVQYIEFGNEQFFDYRWRWIAKYKSVTARQNYVSRPCMKTLKCGDCIFVNYGYYPTEFMSYPTKWTKCQIHGFRKDSKGDVFVKPVGNNDNADWFGARPYPETYCVHLDSQNECVCLNHNCSYCRRSL